MGKTNTEKFTIENIESALKATMGKVYLAAERVGCDAKTIYNYCKRYPELQKVRVEARGRFIDMAEIALQKAVNAGEAWAVCFLLKTQGQDRGYIETQKHEHKITQIGVVVDEDFYGHSARLHAGGSSSPTPDSDGPESVQGDRVRKALGQDGSGARGNGDGSRE